MQIYASSHAIEQACQTLSDLTLRKLFQKRYDQLKSDDYEIQELVHFWVVESVEDLSKLPPIPDCKEQVSSAGYSWVVVFNTRPHPDKSTAFIREFDRALWSAARNIKLWPSGDLFN